LNTLDTTIYCTLVAGASLTNSLVVTRVPYYYPSSRLDGTSQVVPMRASYKDEDNFELYGEECNDSRYYYRDPRI
jgi:hypothetical protein